MTKLGALILLAVIATVSAQWPTAYAPAQLYQQGSGSVAAGGAHFGKESGNQEQHDNKHVKLSMGSEKGSSSSFDKAQGSIGAVAGQGQFVNQQQQPYYGYVYPPYPQPQPYVPPTQGWGQPTHPPPPPPPNHGWTTPRPAGGWGSY